MKEKKADIVAVAKSAGVSISTVSRSYNHPNLVKATTRKKIDRAVRRLGYIRNRAAQTIHGIRSGTIGLLVPTIDHTIFAELVQTFSDAVDQLGFTILLASHGYDLDREYALARKLLEHRVDGLALVGLNHAEETYSLIERQKIPSILLWNHTQNSRLPCVGSDNFEAGRLVGNHILKEGHRKIASLFPPLTDNDRAAQRFDGLRSVLAEAGVELPSDWVLSTPYSVGGAKDIVGKLLSGPNKPDAIVCGNDVLAWGAMHAANMQNVQIPDNVSIIGIGDFKGSKDFEPPLKTVRIPARQIGERAAVAIADAIISPDHPVRSELVPPKLIVRGTTCPQTA